jgi:hypothetical protein
VIIGNLLLFKKISALNVMLLSLDAFYGNGNGNGGMYKPMDPRVII